MKKNKVLFISFLSITLLVPLMVIISKISWGNIPFWYDPARDLTEALSNLQKPTLIGSTSGIPGIFYGPYWIWFLSFGQIFSKDPRVITVIVLTIPYFIIFPYILFKFKYIFGNIIPIILWLLFILSFYPYTMQIWNPHLAPLLCLITLYFLITTDFNKNSFSSFYKSFLGGIAGGLLMNIHISFGLSVIVGSYLYLIIYKHKFKAILLYTIGLLIMFLPFFVFEIRHGFNQIQTIIHTLTSSTKVVRETGSDKLLILNLFFERFSTLIHLSKIPAFIFFVTSSAYIVSCILHRKLSFDDNDKKILLLISTISLSTLTIYLTSKNPVWNYHFVGVEVLFMLLLGIILKKIFILRNGVFIWAGVLLISFGANFISGLSQETYKISSLATTEHIVDIVYKDAKKDMFSVYTYSPAHFTPEFDYIFSWQKEKRRAQNFVTDGKGKYIYLVIPETSDDLRDDFIDNRTPNTNYRTLKKWDIADGTAILKREMYEKK